MGDYDFVADRVAALRGGIAEAARAAGRDPAGIELMAVSKFHPRAAVTAAWEAGITLFGESRVQEAEGKFGPPEPPLEGCRLELIGLLQTNKAKKAAALFDRIQSVDSIKLLRELGKRAATERSPGRPPLEILLELHTGEDSKSGFPDLESLYAACEEFLLLAESGAPLRLRGLMTMAPYTPAEAPIRASFTALRGAFESITRRFSPPAFDVLSMGMTNDWKIAVEEGSTLLRIGTAIFSERLRE
jgi:pyridoxal phosphate enzyme (YggS family)